MQILFADYLHDLAGLLAGGAIGLAFGWLQAAALRQHEQLERSGRLRSVWSLMPGSGARVAYLLIALALVQFICPLLFVGGTQWWVSAGVVAGYGWRLYRQLRDRLRLARV
jgi:hypothetical protein